MWQTCATAKGIDETNAERVSSGNLPANFASRQSFGLFEKALVYLPACFAGLDLPDPVQLRTHVWPAPGIQGP